MIVAVAADHAGFRLKQVVATHLAELGHRVLDQGTWSEEPVDYPPICARCARKVVSGDAQMAIVIGGSGQGEAISANKVRGVRAALCHDEFTARLARQHNDANVLAIGARVIGDVLALDIVDVFLSTSFEGGRHARRVAEIAAIEAEEAARG